MRSCWPESGSHPRAEKESGSGNVITERTELEAERQLKRGGDPIGSSHTTYYGGEIWTLTGSWPTGYLCPRDCINFTKEAEFEYMPVSYQTGTYDQKWIEKLCVQNYKIGAVLTEMYTHAEHLQKTTDVKTRAYGNFNIVSIPGMQYWALVSPPGPSSESVRTLFLKAHSQHEPGPGSLSSSAILASYLHRLPLPLNALSGFPASSSRHRDGRLGWTPCSRAI
ncbi:Uncharacterised protein [uncultured archaeon]|nr:Uncharacterised protein [uncultured archaeon]